MKFITIILIIFSSLCISSCSSGNLNKSPGSSSPSERSQSGLPAHIAENQSIVTAQVEQINSINKNDFTIKVKILEVKENPAYLSMAAVGAIYKLTPNYKLDEKRDVIQTEENFKLLHLSSLNIGDTFKAVIFYEQDKGWLIDKVLLGNH